MHSKISRPSIHQIQYDINKKENIKTIQCKVFKLRNIIKIEIHYNYVKVLLVKIGFVFKNHVKLSSCRGYSIAKLL